MKKAQPHDRPVVITVEKEKDEATEAVQAGKPLLDLAQIAKPQDYAGLTTEHLGRLAIERPPNEAFFRIHLEHWQDLTVYEHMEGMDRVSYLILGDVYKQVIDEPVFKHKRFHLYVTRDGACGLWGVSLPDLNGRINTWSESAMTLISRARKEWVRCVPDKEANSYGYRKSKKDFGEPKWPTETWLELLTLAFKGHVIEDLDHDILKKLRGDI
jgi:hypothetical protein